MVNVDWGFESPILSDKDICQPTFEKLNKSELA
jgi:hypothetical protein